MTDAEKKLKIIGGFLALLAIPLTIYLNAWAVSTMWGWFVAAPFALPLLPKAQAFGLAMTVRYITSDSADFIARQKISAENSGKIITLNIIGPLITVGIGWIVKTYFF